MRGNNTFRNIVSDIVCVSYSFGLFIEVAYGLKGTYVVSKKPLRDISRMLIGLSKREDIEDIEFYI